MCGQSLKIVFQKIEKSPWEHYISKNSFILKINFYTFKVTTTKFHENSPCFKGPFICLKHSRKMCEHVVFLFQKSFFLIKCSPNHFKFFVNFNIFHKKGSICSKHSKKKKLHMHFQILILKHP